MKYLRVWGDVVEKKFSLDDYSEEAMNTLLNAAEKIYNDKEDEICSFLDEMVKDANTDAIKLKTKDESLLLEES